MEYLMAADAALKGMCALVTLAFAGTLLLSGARTPAHGFLVAFLLLIAANQAAERVRFILPGDPLVFPIATVFAALDPFFLYYFASIHPTRNAYNRTWAVAAMLACAAVLAFLAPTYARWPTPSWPRFALTAYTALAYTLALVALLPRSGARSPSAGLLFVAMAIATVPAWSRLGAEVDLVLLPERGPAATALLPLLAVLAVALVARGRLSRSALAAGLGAGAAMTLLTQPVLWKGRDLGVLHSAYSSLRWLAFAALVSVAALRHEGLGTTLLARRRTARVLLFSAVGVTALTLILAVGHVGGIDGLEAVELTLLAVALVASQTFGSMVDAVAERVYLVPRPGDRASAMEAYRAAAANAGSHPSAAARLATLRDELGLDLETAHALERMAPAPGHLSAGQVLLGRYEVAALVGRGGSGRVFRARDRVLHREVALKEVLHDEGSEAEMLREARLAGALQHPNVATLHDVVQRPGSVVLVEEWLSGGSLEERVKARGRLPLDEALEVVDGVLAGLAAVHAEGIVHRDLKPGNVLLAADGAPKLADFGLARHLGGATRRVGAPAWGTVAFMAPEQAGREPVTPRADLYAVGRLLQACGPEALPPPVESVVQRALAPRPEDRWGSAREMREALRAARAIPGR